jgi:uncharacterized 2Fe-2S/4Fe-4S cluster protein (DUF4445 family)
MTESSKRHFRVVFEPEGRTVAVLEGALLLEAAARAGIVLDTPCGGQGTCGKCAVRIVQGAPAPTEADRNLLDYNQLDAGHRLACRAHVHADMVVEAPRATRFFEQRILTYGEARAVALAPTVRKTHLKLPAPTLEDARADADRLLDALPERHDLSLELLSDLSDVLRERDFEVTVAAAEGRILAVEPGDTTAGNLGVAFDIGTTTVAGFLLDLDAGRELAVAARTNPQATLGDDVVSRIAHADRGPDERRELQDKVVQCLNLIVADCCARAGRTRDHIYEATVAGNTTMGHLLLGLNPSRIAQAPYVPVLRRAVNVDAADLRLAIHPRGVVHVLPSVAGFVGGDTVGVILAAALHEAAGPTLVVDVGTNGELVCAHDGRLVACSTAAGPAFEGARLAFGMRAAEGAVDACAIDEDLEINVIGGGPARGICGTAVIDLVAELLRVGVVDATGRLLGPDALPAGLPEAVARRVVPERKGFAFVVARAEESALGEPILLTQKDLREFQLAKGAIAAGVSLLLKELGLHAADLEHVLLAGAFGNFIRRSMAVRVGLLPDVPHARIRYIGNAAGAGARMALLSRDCKEEADRIAGRVAYLELSGRPDFQSAFAAAMRFPEASHP